MSISGTLTSGSCDSSGNFSFQANLTGSTGAFNAGNGTVSVSNNYIKISTSWLGVGFDLSASSNRDLTGAFTFDYDFTNQVTLPKVTKSRKSDGSSLVGYFTRSASTAAKTVGGNFTITMSLEVKQHSFSAKASFSINNIGISVDVPADRNDLSEVKTQLLEEIKNNYSRIWSTDITNMGNSAANAAKNATNKAYNKAYKKAVDAANAAANAAKSGGGLW